MTIQAILKALDRLALRILMTICRGRITVVDDGKGLQIVQVRFGSGEVTDNMPRIQEYGFSSVPFPGAHAIAVFINGDRSNGAVIGTNDFRYRLKGLQPGEVAIYDDQGQKVHLTRDGITIHTAKTLRLEGKDIQIHATDSFRFDVNGHGQHWFPNKVDTWQIGALPGASHAISPPEIS